MMRKGIELALKVAFIACLVMVLVEIKWLVQDQVFDRQDVDSMVEKGIVVGKRVIAQASVNGATMLDQLKQSEAWKSLFEW